jgi:hypothetical protein
LFSATPAGAGGVSICTGSDFYKFNYNWVCGNLSTGDGGGIAHIGFSYPGTENLPNLRNLLLETQELEDVVTSAQSTVTLPACFLPAAFYFCGSGQKIYEDLHCFYLVPRWS